MADMPDDTIQFDSPFSAHFTFAAFAAGTDPANERQVFGLRYQVYCLERLFLQAEHYPDECETDEYDDFSAHVAAYSLTGMLVGSLRLVTPPGGSPFPFEAHCPALFADRTNPPRSACAEVSRLVISKLYRRRADDTVFGVAAQLVDEGPPRLDTIYDRRKEQQADSDRIKERRADSDRRKLQPEILLGLVRHMYQYSKRHDIHYWYMALEKPLARLLHRIFFFTLEPIGDQVDYYGPVIPCILPVAHFEEALSRGDPVLFAWFQDGLDAAVPPPSFLKPIPCV